MMTGKFFQASDCKLFALAGRARLTFVSQATGKRFTFKVSQPKNVKDVHFVSLLTGPSNEADYTFLGTIFGAKEYRHGKKSTVTSEAPSAKAFAWVWSYLSRGEMPPKCEVYHEGCCGRCGRALTVPESISSGFGPDCVEMMGVC